MCGIAGIYLKDTENPYIGPKELEDVVDWLHCGIEHRGGHATGIAVQNAEGQHFLEKSDMTASKFIFWRQDIPANPRSILLHTRLATKGKPENLLNNHPVQYKNIMAIHNGHINNDDDLFKEEEIERIAEVDSEIIPALFNKYGTDDPKVALEKLSGGFAIAVIDEKNPGRLILAKGSSSPLMYLETSGMWIWASESEVILKALEFGMGFEAKRADINELKYGEYLMIRDGNSLKEDFKPYVKTWSRPQSTITPYNPENWRDGSGSRTRSYGDGWSSQGGMYGRDQCDECFVWYALNKMTRVNHEWFCENCLAKLFEPMDANGHRKRRPEKPLSKKERKRQRKQKARGFRKTKQNETKTIIIPKGGATGIAEALDEEHWAVCQLVAEFYATKPDFVNFLLFSDVDVEDFEDPNLVSMYLEFESKYKEYLEEVRGETDAIIDEITNRPFPIGFGG